MVRFYVQSNYIKGLIVKAQCVPRIGESFKFQEGLELKVTNVTFTVKKTMFHENVDYMEHEIVVEVE